jgi:hypothetical protein
MIIIYFLQEFGFCVFVEFFGFDLLLLTDARRGALLLLTLGHRGALNVHVHIVAY